MFRAPHALRSPLRFCLLAATLALLAGCMPSQKDNLVFTFAGYQHTNPEMVGDSGNLVYVRTVPLITSHNIVGGELVENDGTYAVKLHLDRIGQDVWLQACKQLGGRKMAVVIDGFYLFSTTIPHRPPTYEWFLVEGPWEEGQARGVATHAKQNYEILDPKFASGLVDRL
jgi:preprotein translocase subunit SecD